MDVTYNAEYPRRLRTCFIGCGGHAVRNVYPTFLYAPVELTAVCDLDAERAAWCARQFGAERSYGDYRVMLEKERPEAVFVVTNYGEDGRPKYPAIAMDAMRAGAHVWIEKPPAASSAEVRAMRRVEEEAGRFTFVGLKKMFFPANRKAKEIVSSREFGEISAITARYPQALPPFDKRQDPWAMLGFLDHVVHPHSLLKYLAGPLSSIYVERAPGGAAVSALRFESGAVGSLLFSHGQSGYSPFERTEVVGEGANVVVDNSTRVTYYRQGVPKGGYGRAGDYYETVGEAPLVWEPEFSLGQLYNKGLFLLGYAPETLYFCDCVLNDRKPAVAGLDDALEMLLVYEAYGKADGQVVPIERG
jgi:predicted dehydrogenase